MKKDLIDNYWREKVLLTLDEFIALSVGYDIPYDIEKFSIKEIKGAKLAAQADNYQSIVINHINNGCFKISNLSYIAPFYEKTERAGKHIGIKLHKKDIAAYLKQEKSLIPELLLMPKVMSIKSLYPPAKESRMKLIGLLALYLVKITGKSTDTIEDPNISGLNNIVQFFNENNGFEVKYLGGRTAKKNLTDSILLLKKKYPLICDKLESHDVS